MLICDADTVLLVSPSYLFEHKKYKQTGAFFYRDRETATHRESNDITFFNRLFPSMEDSAIFNLNQTTDFTLENNFFRGSLHFMESGVVVMNREKHFIHLFVMSTLSFFQNVSFRIHGGKELFWLSLSILGTESYSFNDNAAAAVGEFTPEVERHKDADSIQSFRFQEICSAHSANISDADNQTLVWFNSGFRFCGNSMLKKMKWEDEFKKKDRYTSIHTLQDFKVFYRARMQISHGIIPPFHQPNELSKNVEHEPEQSWSMTDYCSHYTWCTWSSIGGYHVANGETKLNRKDGTVITFSSEQKDLFEKARDIWMAEFDWEMKAPA